MLREARIVMPYGADDSLRKHRELREELTRAFGGFTAFIGEGGWHDKVNKRDVDDMVYVYDVAIEAERDASWDKLFQIAMTTGRALGQQAVYIRYPDGSVSIEPVGSGYVEHPDDTVDRFEPKMPLGAKQVPQVGETWRNARGDLVAVVSQSTRIGGGFNVVILTIGDNSSSWKPGATYVTDLDGHVLPDKSSHPRDLKRFVKNF